jgi:flagellar biosynthetic protein FliP
MLGYIFKRVLYMIPTLFGMSVIAFMIIQLPPGDYITSMIATMSDSGQNVDPAQIAVTTLAPAFMLSELKRAFEIGFLIFVPFLIIDMAVASILMSMGMMMLPPVIISLPFKLIFFVLVDGWRLIAGSLVQSYMHSPPPT